MKNNLAMCTQKVAHPNLQLMFKNMNDIVGYTKDEIDIASNIQQSLSFLYHNYCDMARSHRIMTNNSP